MKRVLTEVDNTIRWMNRMPDIWAFLANALYAAVMLWVSIHIVLFIESTT